MNRRTFIIGAGGIGAATIGGLALTGSAAAEAEAGVFGITDKATIDTNNGRLESLTLSDVNVMAEWSGFNYPATYVHWELDATVDDETHTIGDTDTDVEADDELLEGVAHDEIDDIELLEYFDTEDFEVPPGDDIETDATEKFDIEFTLTAMVQATDDSEIEGTIDGDSVAKITNHPSEVDAGIDGELDGEGDDVQDPEDPEPDHPYFESVDVSGNGLSWEIGVPSGTSLDGLTLDIEYEWEIGGGVGSGNYSTTDFEAEDSHDPNDLHPPAHAHVQATFELRDGDDVVDSATHPSGD